LLLIQCPHHSQLTINYNRPGIWIELEHYQLLLSKDLLVPNVHPRIVVAIRRRLHIHFCTGTMPRFATSGSPLGQPDQEVYSLRLCHAPSDQGGLRRMPSMYRYAQESRLDRGLVRMFDKTRTCACISS